MTPAPKATAAPDGSKVSTHSICRPVHTSSAHQSAPMQFAGRTHTPHKQHHRNGAPLTWQAS
jgi:hypothetical protein